MSKVVLRRWFDRVIEGNKRQNIPYALQVTCDCGKNIFLDMCEEDYISSPMFGDECHTWVYCNKCEKETKIRLKLDIIAELINE